MRVELDKRPSKNQGDKPFFAIRLFPETNQEMGDLEWGLAVMGNPGEIVKGFNNGMMYAVCFKQKDK